uniref:AAA-like domain-containing protein n=1 Tax=Petrachloros mirabilis TaxID=2918835 RepID=UPI0030842F8E
MLAVASRHLKNIEVTVLKGVWQGKTYDQIAQECGYAPEYIKHDVGPKLWQLLSASFGEKVSKTSLIACLTQWSKQKNHAGDGAQTSINAAQPTSKKNILSVESPVGLVPLHSNLYVERPPIESRCYQEVMIPGALIRIKAPSQMGKTSLMVRVLNQARKQHTPDSDFQKIYTVALNLQRADSSVFSNLDRLLQWFCGSVARKLKRSHRVEDHWSEIFGSKSNCTTYFEDCLLSDLNGFLVLAIDQVDQVFSHPEIADDFFTLLRSWYEEAAYGESGNSLWQKLKLVLVHSTEVYIPLDINKSPFNVGLAIELPGFTPSQALDLAQRYCLDLSEDNLIDLMQLVSGHPYLLRQAFHHLAQQDLTLTQLLATAATDAGIYHNHLHCHLQTLQQYPQLVEPLTRVVQSSLPIEVEQFLAFKLHSMGLVKLVGNKVMPTCDLYRQYFSNRASSIDD